MQRATGLDAQWVDADDVRRLIPAMAEGSGFRGGSYVATDGWVDPPRNVRAYSLAMQRRRSSCAKASRSRVSARAGRSRRSPGGHGGRDHRGHDRDVARAAHGWPGDAGGREAAGARAWVGYARHQVVVTEASDASAARQHRDGRSTSAPASTGGRRRAACCGACRTPTRNPARVARSTGPTCGRWSGDCTGCARPRRASASRRRGPRRSSTRPTTSRSRDRSSGATAPRSRAHRSRVRAATG